MERPSHDRSSKSAIARLALAAALTATVLTGCATDAGLREEQRLALYREHAGAPVSSFQYFGRLNGWTPLGDRALAERAGPWHEVQAFGFALLVFAVDGAGHMRSCGVGLSCGRFR